ncbi:hypothetical protein CEXT_34801 [Caerostris extrusa]|uniref:Uncharacterized protein n=1 Tax=Caerostris extrusa TaxID=172846 RepID=A0AAV4VWD7_CAEEX|nr:hypothetical protein CEXT_34801 [Caerostris extrusa]
MPGLNLAPVEQLPTRVFNWDKPLVKIAYVGRFLKFIQRSMKETWIRKSCKTTDSAGPRAINCLEGGAEETGHQPRRRSAVVWAESLLCTFSCKDHIPRDLVLLHFEEHNIFVKSDTAITGFMRHKEPVVADIQRSQFAKLQPMAENISTHMGRIVRQIQSQAVLLLDSIIDFESGNSTDA